MFKPYTFKSLRISACILSFMVTFLAGISVSHATLSIGTYDSVPPTTLTSSTATEPLVMLVMGNDHQLFYKAYNDWSDLNNDGTIESTYTHSIDYYGYFDSYKCYDYDATNDRFSPMAITADKYCTGTSSTYWSGNFLNWATMSRMDIVRKVLYGGKRSTDTAILTILERAHLPTDAHSFAKFYNGADINQLSPFSVASMTMCNTTYASGANLDSEDVTDPPLLRIAAGDFRYWNANERWQCTWDNERGDNNNGAANTPASASTTDPDPTDTSGGGDGLFDGVAGPNYTVRVQACASTALIGQENCKAYGASLKPVGLLHTYGENENIKFGLLTGSYKFNKSGGVVRKDISTFSDEVNNGPSPATDDGTFTGIDGIVKTLDTFRITRYRYGDGDGNGRYNVPDNCSWGLSSFTEGDCSNWGNPASEMYLEAVRYFAGLNRNNSFSNNTTDDDAYISGLKNITAWTDPLTTTNYCAACNIIMLNTSDFSYDADSLAMTGLATPTPDAITLTNNIGTKESIAGNSWFVGENGVDNNQLCTAKTITNLGAVKGTCPGSPRLEGSYNVAGVAHWAHTNDIRALTGTQKVNTYAVALSPSVPQIKIPVPSSSPQKYVTILPACRNTSLNPDGNCALVNFTIVSPHAETVAGSGTYTGVFNIHWEDSEQGGDYDQDMKGTIAYSITSTGVTVTTNVDGQSTGYEMGFGYIISGTTKDGFHVHSGINSFDYNDPDASINDCSNCASGDAASNQAYTIGTSTASLLEDPLWYAAKWGGFTDLNGNNEPDSTAEWDNVNNDTNAYGADGLPDNYFLASNPGNLETQLGQVFTTISQRLSSGTAAAVIANTTAGTGEIMQALYQPQFSSADKTQQVSWVGMLHSIFLDDKNYLREDGNSNATLDGINGHDYTTDMIIQFFYDSILKRTRVARFTSLDGSTLTPHSIIEIDQLGSIWNARDELNKLTDLTTQRSYTTAVAPTTGRFIKTWLDDGDGVVETGEYVDFVASTFTSSNYSYLMVQNDTNSDSLINETDSQNIVEFIRGKENVVSGFRSRTIDYDNDNTDEVWRLGDIIHSSPIISEAPADNYDSLYGDFTYTTFKNQYAKRRQMVYVGANDGMLHAFNGGFFNVPNRSYDLTRAQAGHEAAAPASHPLGAEIWSYVPRNLLPHLQWLTAGNYPHVYYVDGRPKVFDVNIFPNDTDHPGGWGTILVATMRLGGGASDPDGTSGSTDTTVDVDFNNDATVDFTTRSAVMIFDITNPEKEPVLLAEYTDPYLGFTTSTPNIVAHRQPDATGDWAAPSVNNWYLIFGAGPTDLDTVTSTRDTTYLYSIKLNTIDTIGSAIDVEKISLTDGTNPIVNSFVGDTHVADWSRDFQFDTIYAGIAGISSMPASASSLTAPYGTDGRLMRILTVQESGVSPNIVELQLADSSWTHSTVINPNRPFLAKPSTTTDEQGKYWVYAGTGRLFTTNDNSTSTRESMYGIKEDKNANIAIPVANSFSRNSGTTQVATQLTNVTDVKVFVDGSITDPSSVLDVSITNFNLLETWITGTRGWYNDFDNSSSINTRNFTNSTLFRSQVLFTTYRPPVDTCQAEGTSQLWALYYKTGTAYPDAAFGNSTTSFNGTSPETPSNIDLGLGVAAEPIVYKGTGANDATVVTNMGTGEIRTDSVKAVKGKEGRQSWREIFFNE